jgi:hypothetical protein
VRIGEGKRRAADRGPLHGPIEVAVSETDDPRAAPGLTQRPLTSHCQRRSSDRSVELPRLPGPLAQRHLEFCAEPIAVALRIRAGMKRRALQPFAGEHRQRSQIAPPVNAVPQPRGRNAVDDAADMTVRTAADRKLATIVIDRRHAWQRLNRLQHVIDRAARLLKAIHVNRDARAGTGFFACANQHRLGIGSRHSRIACRKGNGGCAATTGHGTGAGVPFCDNLNDRAGSRHGFQAVWFEQFVKLCSTASRARLFAHAHVGSHSFGTEDDAQALVLQNPKRLLQRPAFERRQ